MRNPHSLSSCIPSGNSTVEDRTQTDKVTVGFIKDVAASSGGGKAIVIWRGDEDNDILLAEHGMDEYIRGLEAEDAK